MEANDRNDALSLSASIAAQLRASISNGDIAPGTRLPLDDLRARYGVSLTPLREALSRLCAEGFVMVDGLRGYRVVPVSEDNLIEVTTLRCHTETLALRESIRRGGDAWEESVVSALYRLNKLERADVAFDQQAWEAAHREVHARLIGACNMPLLLQFGTTLNDLSDRYRRLFLGRQRHFDAAGSGKKEHTLICNAALDRNADLACELLHQHLERTGNKVLKALQQRGGEAPALKEVA